MRRKSGTLVTGEQDVLLVAAKLDRKGETELHGYAFARAMEKATGRVIGYATMYERLKHLESRGFLQSRWEDQASALARGCPPRRFYRLSSAGAREAAKIAAERRRATATRRREGFAEA